VWRFERAAHQVPYTSLSGAGQNYAIDAYYRAEPNGTRIASQIDGNYKQKPYHVWLDEVTLNAY
jgi:hypothetical protein